VKRKNSFVNCALVRIWKEAAWPLLRHFPSICLKGLRKITTHLGQDYRPASWIPLSQGIHRWCTVRLECKIIWPIVLNMLKTLSPEAFPYETNWVHFLKI
jgi:hypothetical protein